ncbi:hypothetical protein J132_11014, partial [Termitomyces sp. J132]
GVWDFAERLKLTIMAVHGNIIGAQIKQAWDVNRQRCDANFEEGGYVCLSTKNILLTKGLTQKPAPKFIGPFCIIEALGNELLKIKPLVLQHRGIHDIFHASLLWIHITNDD